MTLQIDLDVIGIDVDVLGEHSHQIALQSRQVVWLCVAAVCALVGEDELQALFGDAGRFLFLTEQEREQGHALLSAKDTFEQTWLDVLSEAHGQVFAQEAADHVFVGFRYIGVFQMNRWQALVGGCEHSF